ncbi:type I-B CRISPR-associated protein Cas7/Cst2/DevR [Candidatus Pacearchaeota archaeon]|nr:MAG: type I-B CRISPR-associated protein Cas7/Cst2/DevR [Candidatus Pacearchaeota archaeon]
MSDKKGFITLTVVFEAMSLNRDEGMGNIQSLHLLTRGNGKTYSYMSRQALTYAVRKFLIESGKWPETRVISDGDVTQYWPDIIKYPEVDLFGYMVTIPTNELRPAPVTFTHAVSLEPYNSDMSFYANIELSRRSNSNPNPYNKQEHKSLYKYSCVIDLERIGKYDSNEIIGVKRENGRWGNLEHIEKKDKGKEIEHYGRKSEITKVYTTKDKKKLCDIKIKEIEISNNNEKAIRINQLLDAILYLFHQISAYREPLNPLFIAAAHLKYGSPIFHNYVELKDMENEDNNKAIIDGELFEKGIQHAKNILKAEGKFAWSIVKGAGDLHLDIEPEPEGTKDNPVEVIEAVKNWVDSVYDVKT